MQSSWFRKTRFKSGKGKTENVGGRGLGYRERPDATANNERDYGVVVLVPKPVRTGPGADRLSAMKAAYRSQYQSQFTASSDHTWEQTIDQTPTPPQPVDTTPTVSRVKG